MHCTGMLICDIFVLAEADSGMGYAANNGRLEQSALRNGFPVMHVQDGLVTDAQILTMGARHQAGGIANPACKLSFLRLINNTACSFFIV